MLKTQGQDRASETDSSKQLAGHEGKPVFALDGNPQEFAEEKSGDQSPAEFLRTVEGGDSPELVLAPNQRKEVQGLLRVPKLGL